MICSLMVRSGVVGRGMKKVLEILGILLRIISWWIGVHWKALDLCNRWNDEGVMRERLDRAPGSADWFLNYNKFAVSHIKLEGLDHCALLLDIMPDRKWGKKRFTFDKKSLNHQNVPGVIDEY
ncbi:hypothetical protein ACH5RR_036942 [Cinchona calisaya]|uniref:Uncharacterized protein n=1 Tax=Cinchona calisaya TaxID=153742 RepID=A0ABD2Y5Y8_9GENT